MFRFHHVSTDEVYGELSDDKDLFDENAPYIPSSPYSASKAASNHLVRAWMRTYNIPILITNCSNNYGPYHFPEKLIPLSIINALLGKPLLIYGDGNQIRDWLYVEDHVRALYKVVINGKPGETYNIGGHNEKHNLEVVEMICAVLEQLKVPHPIGITAFNQLITLVNDRPGHDRRYAMNTDKIERELGWFPQETFNSGLFKTIKWYLIHREWWEQLINNN